LEGVEPLVEGVALGLPGLRLSASASYSATAEALGLSLSQIELANSFASVIEGDANPRAFAVSDRLP
jgi:hypothetical protein